jgi:hypothetical protein
MGGLVQPPSGRQGKRGALANHEFKGEGTAAPPALSPIRSWKQERQNQPPRPTAVQFLRVPTPGSPLMLPGIFALGFR